VRSFINLLSHNGNGGEKMFIIVVYDIAERRVTKVLKKSRQYLYWVQNSVFEGEISPAKFKKYKDELGKIINTKEDIT
jgi:CRISPR-associated protein Cas2